MADRTVYVDFHDTTLDGDRAPVPSLQAICLRCGKIEEVYGRGDGSKRRALCAMREDCRYDEDNYYQDSEDAPGPIEPGEGTVKQAPGPGTITIGGKRKAPTPKAAPTGTITLGRSKR